jgi:hypothetical protein
MSPSFEGASLYPGAWMRSKSSRTTRTERFYVMFTVGRSKSGRHAADDLWLVLS